MISAKGLRSGMTPWDDETGKEKSGAKAQARLSPLHARMGQTASTFDHGPPEVARAGVLKA